MLAPLNSIKVISYIIFISSVLFASEPNLKYNYGQEIHSMEGIIVKKIVMGPSKTGEKGDLSPQTLYYFNPTMPISINEGVDSVEQPACNNLTSMTCYFESNDLQEYYNCIKNKKIKIDGVLRSRLRGWFSIPVSVVIKSITINTSLD